MRFKYLVINGDYAYGKQVIVKEYFISAVKRGDLIINLQDMSFFDPETNSWKPVQGDEK